VQARDGILADLLALFLRNDISFLAYAALIQYQLLLSMKSRIVL